MSIVRYAKVGQRYGFCNEPRYRTRHGCTFMGPPKRHSSTTDQPDTPSRSTRSMFVPRLMRRAFSQAYNESGS